MAIVVVTEEYASSERCLDELVWIMEWKRSGCGGLPFFVLPVFFSVDPSDVRRQGGSFAKAFGRYEDRVESSSGWMKKVNQWRAALKEVADLGGMGTEKVEGLVLDMQMLRKAKVTTSSMFNVNDAERLYAGGNRENVQKRRRLNFLSQLINNNAEISHEPCFGVDAFSRMERLRILQLSHVKLSGSYALLPVNLRFLSWHGFSSKSIPDDFPLEGLLALDMRNGSLRKAWEGIRILRFLKILNFSHSHSLLTTPNFGGLPSLKRLILKDCTKLAEIHESIGDLEGLTFLNLRGCKNLRRLPTSFSNLKSLEHLVISGCSRLATTTTELGKLESLTTLHADGIAFGHQHTQWRSWLSRLKKAPYSESFVLSSLSRSLVSLSLVKCSLTDEALSTGITGLPSLHFLNLSGNLICSIPQSIIDLGVLKELWLDDCVNLQTLPELPLSLTKLKAAGCTSLQGIRNLPNLWTELFLLVMFCEKLDEVQGLFKLAPINNFDAELVKTLGYLDIEAIRDSEVELFNELTETRSKYLVQGLYEFGIFSTYFPGSEVPRWFSHKQDVENSVTLKLASYTDTNISGLTISMVYSRCKNPRKFKFFGEGKFGGFFSFFIKVSNISSGLKWIYNPTYIGIPGPNEDLVFLCHWKFGKYLASGDDINVSVVGQSHTLRIKEFGVSPVYDVIHQETQTSSSSANECTTIEHYMSICQLAVNHYFFSPSKYFVLKGRSDGDPNLRGLLYDHLFEDHRVLFGVSSVQTQMKCCFLIMMFYGDTDDDSDVDFDEFECDEEEAEEELEELLRWNSRKSSSNKRFPQLVVDQLERSEICSASLLRVKVARQSKCSPVLKRYARRSPPMTSFQDRLPNSNGKASSSRLQSIRLRLTKDCALRTFSDSIHFTSDGNSSRLEQPEMTNVSRFFKFPILLGSSFKDLQPSRFRETSRTRWPTDSWTLTKLIQSFKTSVSRFGNLEKSGVLRSLCE
nr:TMV resistance protein N-like isoform X1 [Ipomoea batatas]